MPLSSQIPICCSLFVFKLYHKTCEHFYRNFGLYEKSPNSFLPGLPRSIVNQFRFHILLCLCLASVHLPHHFHLVFGFQPSVTPYCFASCGTISSIRFCAASSISAQCSKSLSNSTSSLNSIGAVHIQIRLAESAVVSEGLCLADNDVRDKIITVLCVSDIHAVCTPFIGSLCGKLLTGTNTPFAMSSARMAAFLGFDFCLFSPLDFCPRIASALRWLSASSSSDEACPCVPHACGFPLILPGSAPLLQTPGERIAQQN